MDSMANENVEWGAEIPVEGKRPEWLGDDDLRIDVCWGSVSYVETENDTGAPVSCVYWNGATAIRLPANHPRYTKSSTPTRTALEQRISPELVDRMVALARRCADSAMASGDLETMQQAQSIVRELPEPVDGDLLEARELVANSVSTWNDSHRRDCREGAFDSNLFVTIAHLALSRGRALERGE